MRPSMQALVVLILTAVLPAAVPAAPPEERGGFGGVMEPGGPHGPPPFLSQVFPPKLVMENQQKLNLRPAQVDAIKQAIAQTQQRLVDLQWRLEAEAEGLTTLLAADHVDEAAVLEKLERVTSVEQQVKKENFTLLVRIKNQLDADQQATLRALRASGRRAGPAGASPPP